MIARGAASRESSRGRRAAEAISYYETWPQRSPSGPDRPEGGSMGKVIFGFLLEKVWRWLVRIFG